MFNSEEKKIKKQIMDRAIKLAQETYEKEIMFKSLQASDLHYAIISDMIKAANLTGKVVIKLKDGTEILIEGNKEREELNRLSNNLF